VPTRQVEFYLSDANLPTDKHLLKHVQKDPEGFGAQPAPRAPCRSGQRGAAPSRRLRRPPRHPSLPPSPPHASRPCCRPPVPIKLIAGFKRIKALTQDAAAVASALRGSAALVVDDEGRRVRRAAPLADVDVAAISRRIVVGEHLGDAPTIGAALGGGGVVAAAAVWAAEWRRRRRAGGFLRPPSLPCPGRSRPSLPPAPDSVSAQFSKWGKVELVRICSRGQTAKLPAWLAAAVHSLTTADGVFALVEFATEEEAAKAVEGAKNPDNW
jgi:hypothetical protein